MAQPSVVARLLDDGTTQATETDYNEQGQVLARRDPLGRETTYGCQQAPNSPQ